MGDNPCPGYCNSLWRDVTEKFKAALAEYGVALAARKAGDADPERPEAPDIRPWLGEPVWCGVCGGKIGVRLAELDDLGALLAAAKDGLRGEGDDSGRVRTSRDHASPSPSADDLDEMLSMLTGWESAYRELMGWPSPPRRGFLASQLSSVTAWLGMHLAGVLASPFAEDFGMEISAWHREMAAKSSAGTGMHRKPVRCPRCQLLLLTWREGDEYVACGNPDCARLLSLDEYQELSESAAKAISAA